MEQESELIRSHSYTPSNFRKEEINTIFKPQI